MKRPDLICYYYRSSSPQGTSLETPSYDPRTLFAMFDNGKGTQKRVVDLDKVFQDARKVTDSKTPTEQQDKDGKKQPKYYRLKSRLDLILSPCAIKNVL